jgi:RNA polymerase sigma-70 factor, ECF subfamily
MLGIGVASAEARSSASDDNLIHAAQSGDLEAFGALYERYRNQVYSFVARSVPTTEDAEDVTVETFCKAWQALPSYRGDARLQSWLYSIATNLCRDLMRRAPRRPAAMTDLGLDPEQFAEAAGSRTGPEARTVAKFEVSKALRTLPETHQTLVQLCDVEGFTAAEAARVIGCTVISARVRLFRARGKLRELLAHLLDT